MKTLLKKALYFSIAIILCITNITNVSAIYITEARAIDNMLLLSQQWLNQTYSSKPGFGSVIEDGISRRDAVNGCIRAMQIELGITETADNFGDGTISRFNDKFPTGIHQQDYPSENENNIYAIIQCAIWIKGGYYIASSSITKHFYDGTGNAVKKLKEDMGFTNSDSTVTLEIMKSLLSMDQYKLIPGGDENIREIQRSLNVNYQSYLGIIPCDGVYNRQLNISLIKVLQAIEGYSPSEATGNFGQGTKTNLPLDFDVGGSLILQLDKYHKSINLIQYALICNGYGSNIDLSNNEWTPSLSQVIAQFQSDLLLKPTGKMDVDTWMSLLLSKGNPDRSANACDTRFEMTTDRLNYLIENGYTTVGRYLTGGDFKQLRPDEPQRIIDAGLSFFPIFQESGNDLTYFTDKRGALDASTATTAALGFRIPINNIIYFAVDADPTNIEISNYILPYFQALALNMKHYKIGIYGTRNVCTQVMQQGYATTCFISDMSTGFSGNMGFKVPDNWNFDQYHEFSVTTSTGTWDLDKVTYSGKYHTVTKLYSSKVIPPNSIDYYYGYVEFTGKNTGNFFTIIGNRFRYRIVWECPDGYDTLHYLDTYLEKKNIGTVWSEKNRWGEMEYQSDWMPVQDGAEYRFAYGAYNAGLGIQIPANVRIYIDTNYE